jgi:dolichol kinase
MADEQHISLEAEEEPTDHLFTRRPSPYSYHAPSNLAPLTPLITTRPESQLSRHGSQSGRSRRTHLSLSESGTEADDESQSLIIKALPAPPYKPRKGLRRRTNADGGDDVTPPLTPTGLDNEVLRLSDVGIHEPGPKEPVPDTLISATSRSRSVWTRRAEILRRLVEGVLLALSGALVLGNQRIWWLLPKPVKLALLSHLVTIGLIYFVYPFRLVRYSRTVALSQKPFWKCIRLSAAFDPAPYIYPSILPVVVALSLFAHMPSALLPNLVLGLATLPPQVIGFQNNQFTSMVHWLITLVPIILLQSYMAPASAYTSVLHSILSHPTLDSIPEAFSYLYPLHSNLVPLLHSFTTTSLLPAELQLLSLSLIDLLFLSTSPSSSILSIIIWVGGMGIITFCSPVIKWGVQLARIPRWRLRRAGRIIQARQIFINALNSAVRRTRRSKKTRDIVQSDADDDLEQPFKVKEQLDLPSLKDEVIKALKHNFFPLDDEEHKSATENLKRSESVSSTRRRRHTTAGNDASTQIQSAVESPRRKRRKTLSSTYFLSLTPAQASLRKWAYAGYLYFITVLLILIPIRMLVSKYALYDHEPFGWAIGYLFGNIRPLRLFIVTSTLPFSSWIPLPPLTTPQPLTGYFTSLIPPILTLPANMRLVLFAYCITILILGLLLVTHLPTAVEVDTRRKVFHGIMVFILLPTIPLDPSYISLALSLILAIFLLLDLLRASQLPPLSSPIASFLTPYVDGRDLRGPVVISHVFLLIGCAVPLWLSLAGAQLGGEEPWNGWTADRSLCMLSGVICVGLGDAAASLVGRRWGRRKWVWSGGKSLEGSLAFALAVTSGLLVGKVLLVNGGWLDGTGSMGVGMLDVVKAGTAASMASLLEAVLTGGNDNVVVPVGLWVFVRALRL